MNVSAASSSSSSLAGITSLQSPTFNNASDPDGDGDRGGGGRVHGSHRGHGQMRQALTQALQSLGLSMPQSATGAAAASSQTSASTDSDGDSDGSNPAAGSVKQDLRQFMHTLFQAVRSEPAPGASSASSASDPTSSKTNFADGLSALISQVGNGTAPTDLQNAFTKLVADLQPSAPAPVDAATASAAATTASPQATLQALLTALQQDLGYGSSSSPAVGNSISTQA